MTALDPKTHRLVAGGLRVRQCAHAVALTARLTWALSADTGLYYSHNMSQRQRQKTQSRQRIVESAVGLLKRQGLADTSVSEVMAGADLTVGGFYAHFPSKEDLAGEAIRQAMRRRRAQFLDLPDDNGWQQRLKLALQGYFTEQHRDDLQDRCPMPLAAMDAARDEGARTAFAKEIASIADAFQTGRDSAKPRAPRDAALGSLALMVGGMILAQATEQTPLSGEILQSACRYGEAALQTMEEQS